jgi:hypothetical protein
MVRSQPKLTDSYKEPADVQSSRVLRGCLTGGCYRPDESSDGDGSGRHDGFGQQSAGNGKDDVAGVITT